MRQSSASGGRPAIQQQRGYDPMLKSTARAIRALLDGERILSLAVLVAPANDI